MKNLWRENGAQPQRPHHPLNPPLQPVDVQRPGPTMGSMCSLCNGNRVAVWLITHNQALKNNVVDQQNMCSQSKTTCRVVFVNHFTSRTARPYLHANHLSKIYRLVSCRWSVVLLVAEVSCQQDDGETRIETYGRYGNFQKTLDSSIVFTLTEGDVVNL